MTGGPGFFLEAHAEIPKKLIRYVYKKLQVLPRNSFKYFLRAFIKTYSRNSLKTFCKE